MSSSDGRQGLEPVLSFEGVSRAFTGFAAVDRLDLQLQPGEILTLLGPSGCGKTTTLRMAIGLERCTGGRILYRGRVVDAPGERLHVPPEKRDIGMVFQSYAVWPHMSVAENVAFPLRARKVPEPEMVERVKAALAMVGLEHLAARSGAQLSGGQQQRVAIARALVFNPAVLLLDEPFSNLDAQLRDRMRAELKQLQRRLKLAVLFVTHDQVEALALSDRIAVMRDGRVEQVGSPTELYGQPATAFVRDFLGRWIHLAARREGGRLLLDGRPIEAAGPDRGGEGDGERLLAIRPEDVSFEPDRGERPANAVGGVIETLLFLGRHFEAVVSLPGGERQVTELPRGDWTEGQPIWLRLPPQAVQVWPAEPGA